MNRAGWLAGITAVLAACLPAHGVSVRSWTASTAGEFAQGSLEGTALDEDGRVRLAPSLETVWGPAQGIVWAVQPAGRGAFVALSSPGRLLRVEPGHEPEAWHVAEQESLVAALAADGTGGVWFGVSPQGKVLHAVGPGRVDASVDTGALFIWALAAGPDRSVWIGTGVPGRLQRYAPGKPLETVFDSGDDPVRCILPLAGGGVIFGTGGRGRLIRIVEDGKPFVLADVEEDEITAVAAGEGGTIYALAARAEKQPASAVPGLPQAGTGGFETMRVVATPPPAPEQAPPEGSPDSRRPAELFPTRFESRPGGTLYRLDPDGSWHGIWESPQAIPFALVRTPDGRLVVATGDRGELYLLTDEGRSSMLLQIASEQASALARTADGAILVGGTKDARVERLGPGPASAGTYSSPAIDAGTVADWGRLNLRADVPRGSQMRVLVRAGNTAEPDGTWSDWRELAAQGGAADSAAPPTRWLQLRVDLRPARSGESPLLSRLELLYLPRNRAPKISGLSVEPAGVVWLRSQPPMPRTGGPLVVEDPVARKIAEGFEPRSGLTPIRKAYEVGAHTFSWQAQDPDEDVLRYRLELRRDGADAWLPLAADLAEAFFSWDARGLPDGLYRVRVTAEDRSDNPRDKSRSSQKISDAFRIDNTRPSLGGPDVHRRGERYEVGFVAHDPEGQVAAVEVAVDGAGWEPLDPLDGVADSPEERYELVVEPDSGEPHQVRSLQVRVTDASGNQGGDLWVLDPR